MPCTHFDLERPNSVWHLSTRQFDCSFNMYRIFDVYTRENIDCLRHYLDVPCLSVVFESRKQRLMDKLIDLDHFSPILRSLYWSLILFLFSTVFIVYLVYVCVCVNDCLSAFWRIKIHKIHIYRVLACFSGSAMRLHIAQMDRARAVCQDWWVSEPTMCTLVMLPH